MKDLQDWAAVQKLYKSTKNISYIAETLDMSRTTVYSLLAKSEEPVYQRSLYPCKVEPYRDKIIEWKYSSEYQFNGTRIFRELKKLGYTGSIHPLYSFLKKISQADFTGNTVATVRVETPIGDQAQFDWSPYQVIVGTRIREVYCFSMILSASRKKAVVFSLSSDADAIYEAIQELFDELGGVTIELLIDNPKALVIENNPQTIDEIEYNPRALLVAKHLGTELNACNCYWPRTKGKVESPFKYIEEQFIKGNDYELTIPMAAFKDINGFTNDSSVTKISLPTDENLSSVTFEMKNVDTRYIVELVNPARSQVFRKYIIDRDCELTFPYLAPGDYSVRITEDKNSNGIIDTGDLLSRKQPEKVILYRLSDGKDIIKIAERTDLTQTVDIATMFGK